MLVPEYEPAVCSAAKAASVGAKTVRLLVGENAVFARPVFFSAATKAVKLPLEGWPTMTRTFLDMVELVKNTSR